MASSFTKLGQYFFFLCLDLGNINFVQNHHLWLLAQKFIELNQFILDGLEIFNRCWRRPIDHVQEYLASLNMTKKRGSQASTLGSTLDQTGNITQNQSSTLLIDITNTQIGNNGRKGIIGNLWTGRRSGSQQGRFAGIGKSQKAHIGHESQFDRYPSLVTRFTTFGNTWCRIAIGQKGMIATTATTTPCHQQTFPVVSQFTGHFLRL
mmetsp:Transcript_23310/g.54136  ORF Transcript_23310/g.54136 Transcript_23310/m.54136 type:complete len:207 (-) Transcript_23310:249-869(-)